MPAAARFNDLCTGHNCWPPRPSIEASPDVFINGLGAHRWQDRWAQHCCEPGHTLCHTGQLKEGSPDVYVNGRPLGRVDDPVSCGSRVAQGSPDVFANDVAND